TEGNASWQRADRALTLHMLSGHAPRFFAAEGVGPALEASVRALAEVPTDFPPGIEATEAMARLDAIYVQHERGAGGARLDDAALTRYIRSIAESDPVFAWLLGELAAQIGGTQPLVLERRPLRHAARIADLYWLTHLFLLETRYFRRPLPAHGFEAEIEELF